MSETLPVIGATITLIFGLLSLVMPLQVSRTLGIDPEGPLGLSKVRGTYSPGINPVLTGRGAARTWQALPWKRLPGPSDFFTGFLSHSSPLSLK